MNNSIQFIKEVNIKSKAQKELIDTLNAFVKGYQEQYYTSNLSKDFDINIEILRTKRRIELEQNKQIQDKAREKSVLAKFISTTNILIGKKVVYMIEDRKNVYNLKSTSMQNLKVEYEMPLDYYLNPIDFQLTIEFLLRGGKYETNY